jgi:hypothetical protein
LSSRRRPETPGPHTYVALSASRRRRQKKIKEDRFLPIGGEWREAMEEEKYTPIASRSKFLYEIDQIGRFFILQTLTFFSIWKILLKLVRGFVESLKRGLKNQERELDI